MIHFVSGINQFLFVESFKTFLRQSESIQAILQTVCYSLVAEFSKNSMTVVQTISVILSARLVPTDASDFDAVRFCPCTPQTTGLYSFSELFLKIGRAAVPRFGALWYMVIIHIKKVRTWFGRGYEYRF